MRNKPIKVIILLFSVFLVGCGAGYFISENISQIDSDQKLNLEKNQNQEIPFIEILEWSLEKETVTLKSDQDLDLTGWVLRQNDRKTYRSLDHILLKAGVPKEINVGKKFINEQKNHLTLGKVIIISEKVKEEY